MLPTKGYFQDIECPYFENSCGRPYCHFRHRKKQLDIVDESSSEEITSKEVPTYKPTPKSELAVSRSHIPISYVPDIIYRTEKSLRTSTTPKTIFMSKPTYKPTPISILTSAVKNNGENNDNHAVNEIKQSMANTKYVPKGENSSQIKYRPTALEDEVINENLEKHEYKPIGKSSSKALYNPTALEDINESNLSDVAYKPTSDDVPSLDYKPSNCLLKGAGIDFGNLDSEFDMIDEIINMSDRIKTVEMEVTENKILDKSEVKIKKRRIEEKKISVEDRRINSRPHKYGSKDTCNKSNSKKSDEGNKKADYKNKIDRKNHDDDKTHSLKFKKTSSKDSGQEKNKSSSREDIRKLIREDASHKKEHKHKDKEKSKHKRHNEKTRVKDCQDKEKIKANDKIIKRISDDNRKKLKERDKSRKQKEHKSEKNVKDKKKHDKQEKQTSKGSDKNQFMNLNEEISDAIPNRNEEKNRYTFNYVKNEDDSVLNIDRNISETVSREKKIEHKNKFNKFSFENIEGEYIPKFDNLDCDIDMGLDDDETMRECYRIFNEYNPAEAQLQYSEFDNNIDRLKSEPKEEILTTKKRIAHSSAPSISSKFQHSKPNSVPTPGQIMNNRYKIIKAMQGNNEENLIMNEVKLSTKHAAPGPSILEAAKKHKLIKYSNCIKPTSLVDDIINSNKTKQIKKIAPVSNVMNIQRAKAQLEELNKKRTTLQLTKTVAQSNKIGKRQAHVPEYSLNDIPDVLDADKSKLPVNVRTRFLTMLADECCKLYLTQKDAYNRALDEEYSCYQKCKVLVTYRNSAMLAVNRIRKEVQEREQNDLDPLSSSDSSSKIKGGSGLMTLYNRINQYILTQKELDIHGYPRESEITGRAIIKNRKSISSVPLPNNQRKCSRCSKIYLVNKDGKVIYEEECLYHPLKKRTIRGEQIYLCCKSADDSGCATSHTHVSEMSEDAELEGFQTTMPPDNDNDPRSNAIYALDCEMCYTTKGLELTRVTIVDTNCKTVYESLVKPLNEIIDYNTRFSGITKQQMDRINTGILQVQANILHLCNSKTILIGHSLESDMKALKIVHGSVIDTSVLFPHKMGLPHKKALRTLASDYLKKIIQNDVSGHDSAEDAVTCMELVKWKVKEDTKFKFNK